MQPKAADAEKQAEAAKRWLVAIERLRALTEKLDEEPNGPSLLALNRIYGAFSNVGTRYGPSARTIEKLLDVDAASTPKESTDPGVTSSYLELGDKLAKRYHLVLRELGEIKLRPLEPGRRYTLADDHPVAHFHKKMGTWSIISDVKHAMIRKNMEWRVDALNAVLHGIRGLFVAPKFRGPTLGQMRNILNERETTSTMSRRLKSRGDRRTELFSRAVNAVAAWLRQPSRHHHEVAQGWLSLLAPTPFQPNLKGAQQAWREERIEKDLSGSIETKALWIVEHVADPEFKHGDEWGFDKNMPCLNAVPDWLELHCDLPEIAPAPKPTAEELRNREHRERARKDYKVGLISTFVHTDDRGAISAAVETQVSNLVDAAKAITGKDVYVKQDEELHVTYVDVPSAGAFAGLGVFVEVNGTKAKVETVPLERRRRKRALEQERAAGHSGDGSQ